MGVNWKPMTPLSQKAHDISFAVFRVAALVNNTKLRRELEDAATDLVARYEDAANPSIAYHVPDPIDRLDRLVAIAESIKEMKPVNSQVLRRELNNLKTAMEIAVSRNSSENQPEFKDLKSKTFKNGDLDISDMFPLAGNTLTERISNDEFRISNEKIRNKETGSETKLNTEGSTLETNSNGLTVRQEEILAIIRETPYCRLRNIMDKMPKVSERTIRNDIQALISSSLVTRIGAGGPASYFQTQEIMVRA